MKDETGTPRTTINLPRVNKRRLISGSCKVTIKQKQHAQNKPTNRGVGSQQTPINQWVMYKGLQDGHERVFVMS